MLVYLDTNVIDLIVKKCDLETIVSMLKRRKIRVLASEYHTLELLAIPDSRERCSQIKALSALASDYDDFPLAWHHAQELRFEIARCRPAWINRFPKKKKIDFFLREYRDRWQRLKQGRLLDLNTDQYRGDFETGVKSSKTTQKFIRSEQTAHKKPVSITQRWRFNGGEIDFDLSDPEDFWRNECASSWFAAIVEGIPASRDYSDYLDPYLKEDVFALSDYPTFWKKNVESGRVPLNRITGLTHFFQLREKISHGNPYDLLHANFGKKAEGFVTCDKAFFNVLSSLKLYLGGEYANLVLIDRNVSDSLRELEDKLDCLTKDSN